MWGVVNMIKFKTGDRVRIADNLPQYVVDNSPTAHYTGMSEDHTAVPTNRVGVVLEDDDYPYVQWDGWCKWAVHQDTLELVQD